MEKIVTRAGIKNFSYLCIFILLFGVTNVFATNRAVNLVVEYKTVNFAGKFKKAITVNNQIPAPTLHFKQGDHITINVFNHLDKATAIHWHGILVPWQMDGVEGISQKAIPPDGVFHYQFTLYQSGTYWYHAHADVQEQEGLYGAFIIDPPHSPRYRYNKDYVVVLSDWSNTQAKQVLANLKKEGDYYSSQFPLQPSLVKFIHDYRKASPEERKKIIDDYKMMQQMRMSIYDISDVAYDAYLLNGQTKNCPWTASVKVGDTVRLRFIGAAGSTIYHVKIDGAKMQMVHVEGNDVKPFTIDDFTIAPGETYDVLVKIQNNNPYIIYAESIDTLGKVYGALVTDLHQPINYQQVLPFPEPPPVTREMMSNMMMQDSMMNHGGMNMSNQSMVMNENESPMKMKQSMKMPSHTVGKIGKMNVTQHDMKSMPMKTENDSNHASHSVKAKKYSVLATPMKDNMPMSMSRMDHRSMKMNAMSSKNKSAPSTTHHSNTSKKMNLQKPHQMNSMSATSMDKMPSKDGKHTMTSHNMKMGDGMKMNQNMPMNHSMKMSMPTEPTIVGDTISPPNSSQVKTSGTKYQTLVAAVKTNDPNKPVDGVIKMELFGYMERFIWFVNGVPEYKAKPILIEPEKRYRIIFTNNSMMRHPIHIHGHWFILRNGHGMYDPLLHTIEVPPGATAVADIDADASGQWFFHCHHLYHMMTGMARVFQYTTLIDIIHGTATPQKFIANTAYINRPIVREDALLPIDTALVHHPMAHPPGFYFANFLDIGEDPFNNVQKANFKGLYGSDYNKLELSTKDAEISKGTVENADIDMFYWRPISQFWAVKGGVNYFYRPAHTPYWQPGVGIEGLMPFFIDTDFRTYYYNGSLKFDIELFRDTQITNNFFIRGGIRSIIATKTVNSAEIGSGLNQMRYIIRPYYRLIPGLSIFTEFEHEQDYGAFKRIRQNANETTSENTITLGLAFIF